MKSSAEIKSLKRIFGLLIASLTISVIAAFLYVYNDARRDRVSDLDYTAKVIESYYELSFHQWELSLLGVGNRLAEIEDAQERLEFANQALKVYENELLAFGFADAEGSVKTFTGRSVNDSLPNLKGSEKTRRSFNLALARKGITLGEIYYFENVSDWILPIRVPIKNEADEIVAVNTSAIDYSTMVAELQKFGFDPHYQVHMINEDFGTTQLVYPLDKNSYQEVLGSTEYQYQELDTLQVLESTYVIAALDPFSNESVLLASRKIDPINHQLLVSVSNKFLFLEFLDRFKYIFLVYIVLASLSIILYHFVKRNLLSSFNRIRTERANLKSIIESTSNIIGLFDSEKKLIEFNKPFSDSALATDDLALEKGMDVLSEMKHQDQVALFRTLFDRALRGEKLVEEFKYPGPNGELAFKFTYNPVYDGEDIVGLAFFGEDITEIRGYQKKLEAYSKDLEQEVEARTRELKEKNKELELGYKKLQSTQQQLIRAEKMASLGILSAGIGHEINNPLNFIKHGSISLKDQLQKDHDDYDYDEYFFAIEEGVRRASTIVSGLSHFSRIGDAMDEDCDIHQIIENSLTLLSSRFKSKDITIEKKFDAQKFHIAGNEGKLHQVFTNIINNAEQAIAHTGSLIISTENKDEKIVVKITDTGIGMTKEVLNKMLDPFFTTKEPGEGTGLGMFICQMIMDEHEAEIAVKSKSGEGTTFTLTFGLT